MAPIPDPTTQGQSPWWQRALKAGAAGAWANQPQGQRQGGTNWSQIGANLGTAASGIRNRIQQTHVARDADPATATTDPQDAHPERYGPADLEGSNMNFPRPDPTGGTDAPDPTDIGVEGIGEAMENGGVVVKPTLALIGERQPEAVVPLGYRSQAKVRPSAAMAKSAGRRYYGG